MDIPFFMLASVGFTAEAKGNAAASLFRERHWREDSEFPS